MPSPVQRPAPPDQPERQRALDTSRSVVVQAPAGSGKTDLLTRRFLALLAEVEEPGQIVAITFTKAAAAEMRHRILAEIERASLRGQVPPTSDPFSMEALAYRALERSRALGWRLVELPAQLRIATIDSFCRDLALQQPLISGLAGSLEIAEDPDALYRRAARSTLMQIDAGETPLRAAIEALLLWRDNNWQEMEELLVEMLRNRDRWMQGFVLGRATDWDALRTRLERPLAKAVRQALTGLSALLDQVPGARQQALALARFACEASGGQLHGELAELAEFPQAPFDETAALDDALSAHLSLANLLLTGGDEFRKQVDKRLGFPAERKQEKARLLALIGDLAAVSGLGEALAAVRSLPPARYSQEDWRILRACFTLLRHAAAELRIAFAEAGTVDFTEIAQTAAHVLAGADGLPTDAALGVADGLRHLLVDEFQDTSRRQHQLLSSLIAAWPEREGRTCFVVGDPMQSIYFFRDADAELFPRVRDYGLEVAQDHPLLFDPVRLRANFRTTPALVNQLNTAFDLVFARDDGSGVTFAAAQPARPAEPLPGPRLELHLEFERRAHGVGPQPVDERDPQVDGIVRAIQKHIGDIEEARLARERGEERKPRIAVLARAKKHLAPIALALREAGIPFRAVELEKLASRPEVLDALALAHALLNPVDRVAWLGALRAPWCGLSLADLHAVAGDPAMNHRAVPELLSEHLALLSGDGRAAAERLLHALEAAATLRAAQPAARVGSWLRQAWALAGGEACVDSEARANLDLLWSCLDRLPAGEQDLLGTGLQTALDKLTALPDADPRAIDVQLMTIHKSKGLEFEVVIVPELQATGAGNAGKLLAWLERGIERDADGAEEITEFLIAPLQSKGAERGSAKAWVDRVYKERETQEMRRILYVAATRAREQLHLFARPAWKADREGAPQLAEPARSLLATAWPALENEVRAQFAEWCALARPAVVESIAAQSMNVVEMPAPPKYAVLRRLPPGYQPERAAALATLPAETAIADSPPLFQRHQGGVRSRALGTAVHALLEEFARLREINDESAARAALPMALPRIASEIRGAGIEPLQAARIAAEALALASRAASDPTGAWVLAPHPQAASEARWTGVVSGSLRCVVVDRVFRAGPEPGAPGDVCWWIVDYKTAQAAGADPARELPLLRSQFAPQIEAYAKVLRKLHTAEITLRGGLYYPRMLQFDWWQL